MLTGSGKTARASRSWAGNEERAGLDGAFHDGPQALVRANDPVHSPRLLCPRAVTASRRSFRFLLCAPKYVAGTMSLGEVMQAASAFMIVQAAFNWLVENYPRLADWTASASRLASLLVAGPLGACRAGETTGRIVRKQAEAGTLRLRDVSVTLDDGSAVVNEADIESLAARRCCRRRIRHGQEHAGAGDRWPVAVGHGRDPDQIRSAVLDAAKAFTCRLEPCAGRDLSALARSRHAWSVRPSGSGFGHFPRSAR